MLMFIECNDRIERLALMHSGLLCIQDPSYTFSYIIHVALYIMMRGGSFPWNGFSGGQLRFGAQPGGEHVTPLCT